MAKWLETNRNLASIMFTCSECKSIAYYTHGARLGNSIVKKCAYKYCPWCGVKIEDK